MLALEALTLKVTPTVTPLVGVLTPMVVELRIVGVIHIVFIVLHHLQQQPKSSKKEDQHRGCAGVAEGSRFPADQADSLNAPMKQEPINLTLSEAASLRTTTTEEISGGNKKNPKHQNALSALSLSTRPRKKCCCSESENITRTVHCPS